MRTATSLRSPSRARPWVDERTLRLGAALALLLFQFEGMLGLHWDIQWHISVGRDRFWTPPHILLYTSVALRGLLCAAVVLWETWRYRRGAGVDDGNAIAVLGMFHAPLGFVVAGFGALVTALAAPLDDYWHQLYGIDVELWAPFHMLGTLGAFIGGLGSVYVWAALAVQSRRRRPGGSAQPAAWGLETAGILLALTFLAGQMLVLAWPGMLQSPTLTVAGVPVMVYPVLLALGLPWLLVAAHDTLGLRGAAVALAVLLLLRDTVLQAFVPWAVRTGAAAEGFPFRSPLLEPHFQMGALVFDLGLIGMAVIAEGLARRAAPRNAPLLPPALRGLVLGLPAYALGLWAARAAWALLPKAGLPPEIPLGQPPGPLAMWLALPVALAAAALSGWIGGGLSLVWRRNPR